VPFVVPEGFRGFLRVGECFDPALDVSERRADEVVFEIVLVLRERGYAAGSSNDPATLLMVSAHAEITRRFAARLSVRSLSPVIAKAMFSGVAQSTKARAMP
jgi:hypothetical protein